MKHSIKIGGLQREIDIRPMGEDFIVYRKMYVVPLTRENISQINPGDWREHLEEFKRAGWQQVIQAFLLREVRALGSCAMLGWEGNGVVAKMYFTTAEMFDAFKARGGCHCLESRSMPAVIESLTDEQVAELLRSPSRTLRILCFNVGHFDQRYHGQGIATAMIECLKAVGPRARLAEDPRGFLSGHHAADGGREITCCAAARWSGAGSACSRIRSRDRSRRGPVCARSRVTRARRRSIPTGRTWYLRNFPRFYAAVAWRSEYDLDHLMACDL